MEENSLGIQLNDTNAEIPLTSFDKDTIGEILNISMGTSATTISTLLNRKVIITTPIVSVINSSEFEINNLLPVVGVQIEYIQGLSGSNIMIMKRSDIKEMVNILLSGVAEDDDNEELDEMHISAIGEIMNQMMGSSCTALASFLGKEINISIPKTFNAEESQSIVDHLNQQEFIVTVKFSLQVDEIINSEFITVLTMEFAKELVDMALNIPQSNSPKKPKQAEVNQQETPKESVKDVNDSPNNNPRVTPKDTQSNIMQSPKSSQVTVQPLKLNNFDDDDYSPSNIDINTSNFNLLLGVPLEVTVEIGRKRQPIKEILEIRQGSIIELDKQACDPVDIMVNGQLIAKGDVVVIDDNFGVRITEIISSNELMSTFGK